MQYSPEYGRIVADLLLAYPAATLSSITPHALWNHATRRFFELAK